MKPERVNIYWLSWHRNHYNDYLFSEISQQREFNFQAFFLKRQLSSHPWQRPLQFPFTYKVFKHAGWPDFKYFSNLIFNKGLFVIAGWNNPNMIFSILLLSLLDKPFLIWSDTPRPRVENQQKGIKNKLRSIFIHFLFKKVAYILTTGKPGMVAFSNMGVPKDKLVDFPFATDIELFKPKEKSKEQVSDKITFLISGRLDKNMKGQDLAIRAFAALKKKNNNILLRIAGTGPDEVELKALAQSLKVEDVVEFTGWLDIHELRDFYQSGDIYLHPSLFDPFPNAVLEALASGLPVIGSDGAGSVVDRVIDGFNGYRFKMGSLEELIEKMEKILSKPDDIATMSKGARSSATENQVTKNITTLQNIVNDLFEKNNRVSASQ